MSLDLVKTTVEQEEFNRLLLNYLYIFFDLADYENIFPPLPPAQLDDLLVDLIDLRQYLSSGGPLCLRWRWIELMHERHPMVNVVEFPEQMIEIKPTVFAPLTLESLNVLSLEDCLKMVPHSWRGLFTLRKESFFNYEAERMLSMAHDYLLAQLLIEQSDELLPIYRQRVEEAKQTKAFLETQYRRIHVAENQFMFIEEYRVIHLQQVRDQVFIETEEKARQMYERELICARQRAKAFECVRALDKAKKKLREETIILNILDSYAYQRKQTILDTKEKITELEDELDFFNGRMEELEAQIATAQEGVARKGLSSFAGKRDKEGFVVNLKKAKNTGASPDTNDTKLKREYEGEMVALKLGKQSVKDALREAYVKLYRLYDSEKVFAELVEAQKIRQRKARIDFMECTYKLKLEGLIEDMLVHKKNNFLYEYNVLLVRKARRIQIIEDARHIMAQEVWNETIQFLLFDQEKQKEAANMRAEGALCRYFLLLAKAEWHIKGARRKLALRQQHFDEHLAGTAEKLIERWSFTPLTRLESKLEEQDLPDDYIPPHIVGTVKGVRKLIKLQMMALKKAQLAAQKEAEAQKASQTAGEAPANKADSATPSEEQKSEAPVKARTKSPKRKAPPPAKAPAKNPKGKTAAPAKAPAASPQGKATIPAKAPAASPEDKATAPAKAPEDNQQNASATPAKTEDTAQTTANTSQSSLSIGAHQRRRRRKGLHVPYAESRGLAYPAEATSIAGSPELIQNILGLKTELLSPQAAKPAEAAVPTEVGDAPTEAAGTAPTEAAGTAPTEAAGTAPTEEKATAQAQVQTKTELMLQAKIWLDRVSALIQEYAIQELYVAFSNAQNLSVIREVFSFKYQDLTLEENRLLSELKTFYEEVIRKLTLKIREQLHPDPEEQKSGLEVFYDLVGHLSCRISSPELLDVMYATRDADIQRDLDLLEPGETKLEGNLAPRSMPQIIESLQNFQQQQTHTKQQEALHNKLKAYVATEPKRYPMAYLGSLDKEKEEGVFNSYFSRWGLRYRPSYTNALKLNMGLILLTLIPDELPADLPEDLETDRPSTMLLKKKRLKKSKFNFFVHRFPHQYQDQVVGLLEQVRAEIAICETGTPPGYYFMHPYVSELVKAGLNLQKLMKPYENAVEHNWRWIFKLHSPSEMLEFFTTRARDVNITTQNLMAAGHLLEAMDFANFDPLDARLFKNEATFLEDEEYRLKVFTQKSLKNTPFDHLVVNKSLESVFPFINCVPLDEPLYHEVLESLVKTALENPLTPARLITILGLQKPEGAENISAGLEENTAELEKPEENAAELAEPEENTAELVKLEENVSELVEPEENVSELDQETSDTILPAEDGSQGKPVNIEHDDLSEEDFLKLANLLHNIIIANADVIASIKVTEVPPSDEAAPDAPPSDETAPETPPSDEAAPEVPPSDEVAPDAPPSDEVAPEVPPSDEAAPDAPPSDEVAPEVPPSDEAAPEVPPSNEAPANKVPASNEVDISKKFIALIDPKSMASLNFSGAELLAFLLSQLSQQELSGPGITPLLVIPVDKPDTPKAEAAKPKRRSRKRRS
jgi:hypothetical protein